MGRPSLDRIIALHGKLPDGVGKLSYSQLEAVYESEKRKSAKLEETIKNLEERLNARPSSVLDEADFSDNELHI